MVRESKDPTVIRSIAVSATDVIAALEATEQGAGETILRVTPPFSGRMRARIHRVDAAGEPDAPKPIRIDPAALLAADAPAYPDPAQEGAGDPETVEAWRAAVREHFVDTVALDVPGGSHEVSVVVLE